MTNILYKKSAKILTLISLFIFAFQINSVNYTSFFESTVPSILHNPDTVNELKYLLAKATFEGKKISVVGHGKSQGGQTFYPTPFSYRISLSKMNKLVSLNIVNKQATVQAGMTWAELQKFVAPHKLAVKAMQSYNDFSIGGSMSVNVHGQDQKSGQLINTIVSFKLLQPNGQVINVSRTENNELFGLAIGGYGLFGVIIEATLDLTNDVILERKVEVINAYDLANHFLNKIKNNSKIEFYSARFSIGSSHLLQKAFVITYEKTETESPKLFKLSSTDKSSFKRQVFRTMKNLQLAKNIRFFIGENFYFKFPEIISRNNFSNVSIESLPQDDSNSSYILQEYFIPYQNLNSFIKYLANTVKIYNINLLNLTARHVKQDNESMLSFSPQDSCALVLYLNIKKNEEEYCKTTQWTKSLINKAIYLNGTYYLPYHLLARQDQIEKAYPMFKDFVSLKKLYDPKEVFNNNLYKHYAI